VALGKAGARNAGILAVQILSGKHGELKKSLLRYKASLVAKVTERAERARTKKPQSTRRTPRGDKF
jgi:phosphoribosylcarboxyaminoimidazole (NCAIR) mutase